jgi:hypothetical protein
MIILSAGSSGVRTPLKETAHFSNVYRLIEDSRDATVLKEDVQFPGETDELAVQEHDFSIGLKETVEDWPVVSPPNPRLGGN